MGNENTLKTNTYEQSIESKEKEYFAYKPEFDMAIGITLSLPEEKMKEVEAAFEASYGPIEDGADIELLENQINLMKDLIEDGEFNNDFSYNLLSHEIKKIEKNLDRILNLRNQLGKFGQKNKKLDEKWYDLLNKKGDYSRLLYKTTRGYIESRIIFLSTHLDNFKKRNKEVNK